MHQRGETHPRIGAQAHGLIENHERVYARVYLGVPAGGLRYTEECVDLREDALERAAFAQHFEVGAGGGLAQRLVCFLPDSLGNQRVHFAAGDHVAHECERARIDTKAERRVARSESRHAQYADRVFDECRRHVPQGARVDVALAAVGIDENALGGLRHGIDGEIAAREILLERHLGAELHRESAIARGDLALAAGERVLLVGVGVQEHRKVSSHFPIAELLELLPRAADDNPITLLDGKPEQPVPNGSADQIHLHW